MQLREEFKGKTVLVTGASMGLGYTCAEYFERCGSQLVITGRTAKKLENLKSSFRSPGDHLAFSGDLLIEREIHYLVEKIKNTYGQVDIIVHSQGGGYGFREPLLSWEQFNMLHKLNVASGAEINRLLIPDMIEQKSGNIIHVGSIASQEAIGSVGYNTVKAALAAYVRSLGREMASTGIFVTGILPGGFTAPDNSMIRLKENNPKIYDSFIRERLPRKKMGKVEEIIPLVCLLASDAGSMMNGCCVPIDAGEGTAYITD